MGLPYDYERLSHSSDSSEDVASYPRESRRATVVKVASLAASHLFALLLGATICRWLLESGRSSSIALEEDVAPPLPLNVWSNVPPTFNEYSEVIKFNGTIDYPSIYRGFGPEVDEAWDELTEVGYLDIDMSDSEIAALGVDSSTVATLRPEQGGGRTYFLEAFHQLHCVNLLRKVTHWNFPYYSANPGKDDSFNHSEDQFIMHVDHCLEMLRQTLMCHADTTLIFTHWVAVRHAPWPDFNTQHQCRNFDKLHAWARAHEIADQTPPVRPDDAPRLPVPP